MFNSIIGLSFWKISVGIFAWYPDLLNTLLNII